MIRIEDLMRTHERSSAWVELIDPRFTSDAAIARQLSSSTPDYILDTYRTLPSALPVWVPEYIMRRAALTRSRGRSVE